MAIIVSTRTPNTIVNNIRKKIDEEMIDTWNYDDDGDYCKITGSKFDNLNAAIEHAYLSFYKRF